MQTLRTVQRMHENNDINLYNHLSNVQSSIIIRKIGHYLFEGLWEDNEEYKTEDFRDLWKIITIKKINLRIKHIII